MMLSRSKAYGSEILNRTVALIEKQFEKQNIVNNLMSATIMILLLAFGLLSSQYLLLYFTSKAINIITDIMIK